MDRAAFFRSRALGLALLGLCGVLWFYLIPEFVPGRDQSLFPKMIVGWIAFFSVLTVILPPVPSTGEAEENVVPVGEAVSSSTPAGGYSGLGVAGLMLIWGAYVYLLGVLGFYVSTYLMLAVSMYYLGIRKPLPLALRPALVLLVVYLLLQVALNFRLPEAYWQ